MPKRGPSNKPKSKVQIRNVPVEPVEGSGDFRREDSLGYLIHCTARSLRRSFTARLAREQITIGMWFYLRALWEEDGITQRQLSKAAETKDPSTGMALQKMEQLGLIYRTADPNDRRRVFIFLTEKAKRSRKRLLRHAIELHDYAVGSLVPGEEEALRRGLIKVRDRLVNDPEVID